MPKKPVDLLVRSWIEIRIEALRPVKIYVDLLVRSWIEIWKKQKAIQTTTSTSLWGRELKYSCFFQLQIRIRSTSLWGRELKYLRPNGLPWIHLVDLLVRSWIEIYNRQIFRRNPWVDLLVRSWIEIKPAPRILCRDRVDLLVRSWIEIIPDWIPERADPVDLLVRSWIEMTLHIAQVAELWSTSLWGRELKYIRNGRNSASSRRPPCEVVNWNIYK